MDAMELWLCRGWRIYRGSTGRSIVQGGRAAQGQGHEKDGSSHQGQGEPAARCLVVPLWAPKLQLIPADPPEHAGKLLLQHQLSGGYMGLRPP